MAAKRTLISWLTASLLLAACNASTPSPVPSASATASDLPSAAPSLPAPSATPPPDIAALLAERWNAVTSGEQSMTGTIVIGDVQATFSGTDAFNGPDEATALTTTISGVTHVERHLRAGGRRYVQRATGPWLVDESPASSADLGGVIRRALASAKDADPSAGAGNHTLTAADVPFDPAALGFAAAGASGATATFSFTARGDGTPISLEIRAAWTQPSGTATLKASLDLSLSFLRLNNRPSITIPEHVWQGFTSDRWGYRMAYPDDFDYAQGKLMDQFYGPQGNGVTVVRDAKPSGATLNSLAAAEGSYTKKYFKARTLTNEAIAVDGVKARFLTAGGGTLKDVGTITWYEAVVVQGKYVYSIGWLARAGAEATDLATFQQLLATVDLP